MTSAIDSYIHLAGFCRVQEWMGWAVWMGCWMGWAGEALEDQGLNHSLWSWAPFPAFSSQARLALLDLPQDVLPAVAKPVSSLYPAQNRDAHAPFGRNHNFAVLFKEVRCAWQP
jgi:hypothetical protein